MSGKRSGRLALRLALAVTPVIGASLLVFGGLVTLREADLIEADLRLDAEAVAVSVASMVEATPGPEVFDRVDLVDRRIAWLSIRLVELHRPGGEPPRALVDERGPDGRPRIVHTVPVSSEGRPLLVVVSVPLAPRDAYILRSLGLDLVGIAVATGIAGLIALWIGRALVARRVEEVVRRLRAIGQGDAIGPPLSLGADELGAVGEAVNDLGLQLHAARARVEAESEERRLAWLHVRRADRLAAVGKMVSVFAHEIGTPLAVITGRSERLARREQGEGAADVRIIQEQAARISGFVRRLLDYGRHDDRLELVRTRIEEPVRRATEWVRDRVRGKSKLFLHLPSDGVDVDGDPRAIEQVVTNLLVNAADASPDGAEIHVSVRVETCGVVGPDLPDTHVHVIVEDAGPGIPDAMKERVFDPFYTTRPPGEGTGLGLPIVKEIVQDHGGKVTLHDRAEGGLRVVVHLPLAPAGGVGLQPQVDAEP